MPKIPRSRLTQTEDMNTLEKFKRRAKRHDVKVAKATETLLEEMVEQNEKLSKKNLVLVKLYRAAYRLLPDDLKKQVDLIASQLEIEDVHP